MARTIKELWTDFKNVTLFGALKTAGKYALPLGLAFGAGYYVSPTKIETKIENLEKGNITIGDYEGFVFGGYAFGIENGKVIGVKLPEKGAYKFKKESTFDRSSNLEREVEEAFVEGPKFLLVPTPEEEKGRVKLIKKD